jgi:two-component system response regulator RegA
MAAVSYRSVLVVDDDVLVLRMFSRMLTRRPGLAVHTSSNITTARTMFRQVRPATCVVDLQLPDGNGIDLIRELRAVDSTVQLVLITGYGSMEVGAAAVRAGANSVLAKPVTDSEIVGVVMGKRRAAHATCASADRAVWEHVRRVLDDCGGNKSLAARRLRIHRGTLQRWLDRPAPAR